MSPTLELLNPTHLLVDVNIRTDLALDPAFIASIREHGVLIPVVAVETPQGLRVRAGNRRTVAAVEAGLTEIPVMVLADSTDDVRIAQQLVENTQRAPLTTADTLAAVEQLALLGVSPTTIAKRTALPKERVTAALAASSSPTAREAVEAFSVLTLEHAAWIAEFDDDPDLVENQGGFYLRTLESWGYTLSDVEKVCTGDLTEEQAHAALGGDR